MKRVDPSEDMLISWPAPRPTAPGSPPSAGSLTTSRFQPGAPVAGSTAWTDPSDPATTTLPPTRSAWDDTAPPSIGYRQSVLPVARAWAERPRLDAR